MAKNGKFIYTDSFNKVFNTYNLENYTATLKNSELYDSSSIIFVSDNSIGNWIYALGHLYNGSNVSKIINDLSTAIDNTNTNVTNISTALDNTNLKVVDLSTAISDLSTALVKNSGHIYNSSNDSLVEGVFVGTKGTYTLVENIASGIRSHAEGINTSIDGDGGHVEGYQTYVGGNYDWNILIASNDDSNTGVYAHAEGNTTIAKGSASHAEGKHTFAVGVAAHAEGFNTLSSGTATHAEGQSTTVSASAAHAEGYHTTAKASYSHAEGRYTTANNVTEHAEGQYNISHKSSTTYGNSGNTLHSIGIGLSNTSLSNAIEVMQNGDMYVTGIGGYDGSNYLDASTLQEVILDLSTSINNTNTKVTNISTALDNTSLKVVDLSTAIDDLSTAIIDNELIISATFNALKDTLGLESDLSVDWSSSSEIPDNSTYKEAIEYAYVNVTNISTAIDNTNTKVTDLSTAIDNTNTKVTDLSTAIDNTNTKVDDLSTAIDNTNTKVTDLSTAIDDVSSKLDDLSTAIIDNEIVISTTFSTLKNTLGLEDNLYVDWDPSSGIPSGYTYKEAIEYVSVNASSGGGGSDVSARLNDLSTAIDNTNLKVVDLSTAIDNTNIKITDLSTLIDNANTNVIDLSTALDNTNTKINNISTALDNTNTHVTNISTAIDNTSLKVVDLSTAIDNTNTKVTNISTAIDTTNTSVINLSTAIIENELIVAASFNTLKDTLGLESDLSVDWDLSSGIPSNYTYKLAIEYAYVNASSGGGGGDVSARINDLSTAIDNTNIKVNNISTALDNTNTYVTNISTTIDDLSTALENTEFAISGAINDIGDTLGLESDLSVDWSSSSEIPDNSTYKEAIEYVSVKAINLSTNINNISLKVTNISTAIDEIDTTVIDLSTALDNTNTKVIDLSTAIDEISLETGVMSGNSIYAMYTHGTPERDWDWVTMQCTWQKCGDFITVSVVNAHLINGWQFVYYYLPVAPASNSDISGLSKITNTTEMVFWTIKEHEGGNVLRFSKFNENEMFYLPDGLDADGNHLVSITFTYKYK